MTKCILNCVKIYISPKEHNRGKSQLTLLWTYINFETIQYAHCQRKFSYMINEKFMKLCTLQDPKMKMCTLVGYLAYWIVSKCISPKKHNRGKSQLTEISYYCTHIHILILPCTKLHELLINHVGPSLFIRSWWKFVHYKIRIWTCAH
jgi:hypothetical protein